MSAATDAPSCPWVLNDGTMCGLLIGHDGDHLPRVAGDYLRGPVLTDLDRIKLGMTLQAGGKPTCPNCGRPIVGVSVDDVTLVIRLADDGGPDDGSYERPWEFSPCGCRMREITSHARVGYQSHGDSR